MVKDGQKELPSIGEEYASRNGTIIYINTDRPYFNLTVFPYPQCVGHTNFTVEYHQYYGTYFNATLELKPGKCFNSISSKV